MNYEEYNDYELVYLAKESNTDANEILFSKYSPIVYNYHLTSPDQQTKNHLFLISS